MGFTEVPDSITGFIKDHSRFLIVGHKEPDGDCIFSQLALARFIARNGKKASLYSDGPFTRSEIRPFENDFRKSLESAETAADTAWIIVDCSSPSRTGSFEALIRDLPVAVIDHHESGNRTDGIAWIEPSAPACVLMIQALIERLAGRVDPKEADWLLLGLCADTGFFRHLESGSTETFEAVSRLVDAGASPKRAHQQMFGGKSLNSRLLMGTILSRTESLFGGRLLISYETLEDSRKYGLESRDSDALYQLFLSIEGSEAVILIRQESEEFCAVGLRSKTFVDVGSIAMGFGGGGHRHAAGIHIAGKSADVREQLIEAFARYM
jgi:phosphoesterase RecJ-like protein